MSFNKSEVSASGSSSDKFYYADGKRVPLSRSARFMAVKPSGEAKEAAAAVRAAAERFDSAEPIEVLRIPDQDFAVVRVASAARSGNATLEAFRSRVSADASVSDGPPVYEIAPGQPAVIPVGEVLVKFKPTVKAEARRALIDRYALDLKAKDSPAPDVYLLASSAQVDIVDIANRLHEEEIVEFAEPNFVQIATRPVANVSMFDAPMDSVVPASGPQLVATDPAFASQWNLKKIKAPEAWDIHAGSSGIAIAIIDEGCDISHEDINYKLPGYDAFAADNDPTPNANDAHGTACAGVAAMRMNNGKGGAGVAPGCRVVPIRIAQGVGGGFWSTTSAKVADGIRKAVDGPRSADVLSNSYGVGPSSLVTDAFRYAQTNGRGGKGCPIAAAAGNANTTPIIYPAILSPTIPGFMAVSATNEWDQRKSPTSLDGETWWGSSFGPEVDVGAPGVHIYATDISGAAGYGSGNYVPNFNGTSSATPHVAGLMGLVLSVDPDLRSWEVEEIIKMSADDLGPGGRDPEFGFGRINCRRALEAASKLWVEVSVVPEFIGAGRECFMRGRLRIYNPGINTIRLDSLTFHSHNASGTTEIDRFEYMPNPGNVFAPRTTQDVRLNGVLLKANGTQASWSYRWSANWTYTFWRPAAPSLPLAPPDLSQGGVQSAGRVLNGSDQGGEPLSAPGLSVQNGNGHYPRVNDHGDSVVVDRQSRAITITIR